MRGRVWPPVRIDARELSDQSFRCVEGCGFCCLCPAGLSPAEAGLLSTDPSTRHGVTDAQGRHEGEASLRLAGGTGACVFLSADRRCGIYDRRPRPCRAFPYSTHLLEGVQVSLNRACPGTWPEAGGKAALAGFDPRAFLSPEAEARAEEAKRVFEAFRARASAAGAFVAAEELRERHAWIPGALSLSILVGALSDVELARDVARPPSAGDARALRRVRAQILRAGFGEPDAIDFPIRVTRSLAWEAYRLQGGFVRRLALHADGRLLPTGQVSVRTLDWLPADPPAQRLAQEHARVLLGRDHLYGLACWVVDRAEYRVNLAQAFEREYWNALGDLWLRASLLARFEGSDAIDARVMQEGVMFFDMDFLDNPTIGGVL